MLEHEGNHLHIRTCPAAALRWCFCCLEGAKSTNFLQNRKVYFHVLDWRSTNCSPINIECFDELQTKWSLWEFSRVSCTHLLGTDCSSWMFKSVLSQQVNGFVSIARYSACSFPPPLPPPSSFGSMGMPWKCTHIAQPHMLSCVIRWRQYPVSIKISHHSSSDLSLMLLPSHMCAIVEKTPATCRYLTSTSPQGPCVTSRFCSSFQVLQRDIYHVFTAYTPCWNAKCCLIFVLFRHSLRI